jgi:hypothetical protein
MTGPDGVLAAAHHVQDELSDPRNFLGFVNRPNSTIRERSNVRLFWIHIALLFFGYDHAVLDRAAG